MESSEKITMSKLNLVDLAGSERIKKTGSEGIIMKEAMFINKSLTFLEQVCTTSLLCSGITPCYIGHHRTWRQTQRPHPLSPVQAHKHIEGSTISILPRN